MSAHHEETLGLVESYIAGFLASSNLSPLAPKLTEGLVKHAIEPFTLMDEKGRFEKVERVFRRDGRERVYRIVEEGEDR